MGDLFNAETENLSNLLSKGDILFFVPDYQRRYSWKEDQWEDFWNDIMDLENEEINYIAPLVLIPENTKALEPDCFEIIDGQQRLTTIMLIFCAIRDILVDKGDNKIHKEINERFLHSREIKGNKIKLQLGDLDHEDFECIIDNKGLKKNSSSKYQLLKAYEFFKNKLMNFNSKEETIIFYKKMKKNVCATFIEPTEVNAHKMFETLNNRGLELSKVDLMKNHLFYIAKEKGINIKRLKKTWSDIVKNLENFDSKRFFRQYFMSSPLFNSQNKRITSYIINEKVSENDLYKIFKEILIDCSNIEDFIRDIKEQSNLYYRLRHFGIKEFDRNSNLEINSRLEDIEKISKTPFTLFLRMFREEVKVDQIIKIIDIVTSLMVRRSITGLTTAPHDTFFNHLAQNMFEKEDPIAYLTNYLLEEGKERFPDDRSFEESFENSSFDSSDSTRYYLSKIETEVYAAGGKEVTKNWYKLHIEHILPNTYSDNLDKNWLIPLNISRKEHRKFKKRIGNLTLLERKLNIHASQRTFERKKECYKGECSENNKPTDIGMTKELDRYDKWGIAEIKDRSEKLSEDAVKIWNIK